MGEMHRIREMYEVGGREVARSVARKIFMRLPLSPNAVTIFGTIFNGIAAILAFQEHFLSAAVVFLLGSLLDAMDGALAKVKNRASDFGAFLDSTLDRVSEGLVLLGIGLMFSNNDNQWALAACVVALASSYLVSYTRARAESLGVECKVGLASRVERVVLLTVGLAGTLAWSHALESVVYILAATSSLTVLQRTLHVRRKLLIRDRAKAPQQPTPPS